MEKYSASFITKMIDFLAAYRWIYDVKVTNLFKEEFWKRIPTHWIAPMLQMTLQQLCHLPAGQVELEWPDDLKLFVAKCVEYGLEREVDDNVVRATVSVDVSVGRGMNLKKKHEVSRLSGYLMHHCKECDVVLDIGSGLGYLGQCLAQQAGRSVLGVECDLYRVEQGNKRHSDITTNQKTKHFSHNNSTEPKKCKGFEKARSHAECSTERNVTSYSDRVASKSFNACDNYANMSNMTCDCCIISDEGANKETSISCKCIVQLSAVDGLPSTQNSCCCGQAGTGSRSGGHNDGKYTDNPSATDKMVEKIPQTCFVIKHLSMSVTSECVQKLDGLVMQFLTGVKRRVCVVGLHCCGDLTPAVLNYFVNTSLTCVHSLVLFGCCYHKMSPSFIKDSVGDMIRSEFHHFPLSSLVKDVITASSSCDQRPRFNFNIFAARLACQETRARWLLQADKEHQDHIRHVGYRAMFEAVVCSEEYDLKHYKQKNNHKKSFDCWENYIDSALKDYHLTDEHHSSLRSKLLEYYQGHHQYMSYIEPFTALQVSLQGVLEHLVVLDRLLFLKEHHLLATSVPIFEDAISPRNTAIVSHKTQQPVPMKTVI